MSSEPLPSSVADSPASPLASPDCNGGRTMSDGSGQSSLDCFAFYDPLSRSWRTSQGSLLGDWPKFSETWPRSGMMRNGVVSQRAPWVRHTHDTGCSLWPTPTAAMGKRGWGISLTGRGRYGPGIIQRVRRLIELLGWKVPPMTLAGLARAGRVGID